MMFNLWYIFTDSFRIIVIRIDKLVESRIIEMCVSLELCMDRIPIKKTNVAAITYSCLLLIHLNINCHPPNNQIGGVRKVWAIIYCSWWYW
jgi:hypothetical protein